MLAYGWRRWTTVHKECQENYCRDLAMKALSRESDSRSQTHLSQIVAWLETVKIKGFDELSKETILTIARNLRPQMIVAGKTLFCQGDIGENYFICLKGCIDIYFQGIERHVDNMKKLILERGAPTSFEKFGSSSAKAVWRDGAGKFGAGRVLVDAGSLVATITEGRGFGELALLGDKLKVRNASAVASKNTYVVLLPRVHYENTLRAVHRKHFQKGEKANCLFFVLSGELKVIIYGDNGTPCELSIQGPGSILGEMALLNGNVKFGNNDIKRKCLRRSADVQVVSANAVLYRLSADPGFKIFERKARGTPTFQLLQELVNNRREAAQRRLKIVARARQTIVGKKKFSVDALMVRAEQSRASWNAMPAPPISTAKRNKFSFRSKSKSQESPLSSSRALSKHTYGVNGTPHTGYSPLARRMRNRIKSEGVAYSSPLSQSGQQHEASSSPKIKHSSVETKIALSNSKTIKKARELQRHQQLSELKDKVKTAEHDLHRCKMKIGSPAHKAEHRLQLAVMQAATDYSIAVNTKPSATGNENPSVIQKLVLATPSPVKKKDDYCKVQKRDPMSRLMRRLSKLGSSDSNEKRKRIKSKKKRKRKRQSKTKEKDQWVGEGANNIPSKFPSIVPKMASANNN